MSAVFRVVVEDVSKRFRNRGGEVAALEGVHLEAEAGMMTAVVGASGSGKTTLLYVIGSLETPDSGKVTVGAREVFPAKSGLGDYRREEVGFVFQSFNLVGHYNALENVMLPLAMAGRKGPEAKRRAQELLLRSGIGEDRWRHLPTRLSGGEQQRVAIARAMANDPRLVLADEPTGNLDSQTGDVIVSMLRELAEEGRCVILVTHDDGVASRCDRIIRLKDGRRLDD